MSILTIIFIVAAILLAFYLINTYISDAGVKKWVNIILVIIIVIWILKDIGLLSYLGNVKI